MADPFTSLWMTPERTGVVQRARKAINDVLVNPSPSQEFSSIWMQLQKERNEIESKLLSGQCANSP